LNSPELIGRLLDNILNVMGQKGYRGLNVDFENVLRKTGGRTTAFWKGRPRLRERATFSSSVAPKIARGRPPALRGADYPAHGRLGTLSYS
jgi:spore germination protein